jgi:hypothetical protein
MILHWDFFKESDRSFGMFYPKHYIVVGLDNEARAIGVAQQFLAEGFRGDDVAFASGSFVTERLESVKGAGLFERIKRGIAHIAGTEQGYIDDDLKLARRGGAFVFVYAPDDVHAAKASHLLKRIHPVYARRYLPLAIDRIVYPNQSTL